MGIVQNEWLTYRGALVCDLVLKMEHLHRTYSNLAGILGMDDYPLGTYNVHTHRDYTDFYSDDAIRAVEEHEHAVIERFGYKFGEDMKKDMEAFSARKTDKT